MSSWIDTHVHLDAAEFDADRAAVVARGRAAGVTQWVLPAVDVRNFVRVRELAHEHGFAYALGIHPLAVGASVEADLDVLRQTLKAHRDDPHLVAVGEIGLDGFVSGQDPARAEHFFHAQLKIARDFDLPVIVHVRRSADPLLKYLRRVPVAGIAHAFNGSEQQAQAFINLGFKLGFGGAMSFERALQIRRIAAWVPDEVPVLETDAPDIPPHWLYRTADERQGGTAQARNEPAELPRIAQVLADLRGWSLERTAQQCAQNARAALPRLAGVPANGGNALADSRA